MSYTDPKEQQQPVTGWQRTVVVGLDRFVYWLASRWVAVFSFFAAIYVGLPILAPVLMNAGATGPARAIYTVYSPMCHQMASRSFFLFGEQPAYPRALANSELTPIEAYMPNIPEFAGVPTAPEAWPQFLGPAREFVGNEQMGYKMALCERDIAIYGFVLIGSILYAFLRRRIDIKPLPFWAFVIIGMGPIALDGFSQLFSQYGVASEALSFLNEIFYLRESSPIQRTLTGALFGFTLVWMAYPHIDRGMRDTEETLGNKLRKAGEL
ncbi:MAG: DUF2085 domain-containing protein [Chloroflexota bacterium]